MIEKMYSLTQIHAPLHPVESSPRDITKRFVRIIRSKEQGCFPFCVTVGVIPRELFISLSKVVLLLRAVFILTSIVNIPAQRFRRKHQQNKAIIPPHISLWECRSIYIFIPYGHSGFVAQRDQRSHQLIEACKIGFNR